MPVPPALKPLLRFARLSGPAYATVMRAVDDDEAFRARVVEAAPSDAEAALGRVGWLWLSRPERWADEVARSVTAMSEEGNEPSTSRLRRERDGAEAAAARVRRDLEASEQSRRQVEARLADEERARRTVEKNLVALQATHDRLGDERNDAVRQLKDVERALAGTRHELRIARAATREVEAELAARPSTQGEAVNTVAVARVDRELRELRRGAGRAVAEATEVASALQQALANAEAMLDPSAGAAGRAAKGVGRSGVRGTRTSAGRPARSLPTLPPGILRGTPDADRLVLRADGVLVVIDGYNVARTTWQGLDPEQERRRIVAMVEEFGARFGVSVRLVFDGVDDAVAPPASRRVHVQFSASGQTADDAILDLLDSFAPEQPVVVVSSDREVMDGARDAGAEAMTSEAFLAAIGR